ncbi:hypothetical protein D3C72_2207350 [compost metagenome]
MLAIAIAGIHDDLLAEMAFEFPDEKAQLGREAERIDLAAGDERAPVAALARIARAAGAGKHRHGGTGR